MKLGVVSQILTPLLREGVLLCLRVSYIDDPTTVRTIWLIGFDSGLAHCYYSEIDAHFVAFDEGWEDVGLWASVLVSSREEFQYKTRDELLVKFTEYQKQRANMPSLGDLIHQRVFQDEGGRPS